MPSTENATLQLIQQEIQDVIERERELKKYYTNNNNSVTSSNTSEAGEINSEDNSEDLNSEGDNNSINNKNNGETQFVNGTGNARPPLLRAISTSVLEQSQSEHTNGHTKPSFRRFVSSHPSTKGVMHRFLKSRGKLQAVGALNSVDTIDGNNAQPNTQQTFKSAFNNNNNYESYEIAPPKIEPGQRIRKGFVSAVDKIQKDIAETHQREKELKTLRQSQGNLACFNDDELDAPLANYMGGLRASKSMAQLYNSNETLDEPIMPAVSAPSSLKPTRSLAQLCDAKEDEVTSSQTLIMRFEQMITKNQDSKRT